MYTLTVQVKPAWTSFYQLCAAINQDLEAQFVSSHTGSLRRLVVIAISFCAEEQEVVESSTVHASFKYLRSEGMSRIQS